MITENMGNFTDLPELDSIAAVALNTAIIKVNPGADMGVQSLREAVTKLKEYAIARTITKDEDVAPITDDLALIAGLKKSLNTLKDQYVKPVKAHLADIVVVFVDLQALLDIADTTNRQKISAYRQAQQARAAEIVRVNQQAQEVARKQAELSGTGEITVDTTPIEAPAPIRKVSTGMGTSSFVEHWSWKIVDRSKIPSDYMLIDAGRINKEVKAGVRNISGLEIYRDDTLRVNT